MNRSHLADGRWIKVEQKGPRYSLMVPTRNGGKYLPNCVDSVLRQNYSDYELIVSNNHSQDGTESFLAQLNHPKVRKLKPSAALSMVEHFEWVLSFSSGEWLMFLGADDGLQDYFFELADSLTSLADANKIRAIMTRRVYFFWRGCEKLYGARAVQFDAQKMVGKKISSWQALRVLVGGLSYFDLPQMYCNSLFRRDLLDEAKAKQGRVFTSITPDANLAAIACSLDSRYLRSEVPLGWVGTSPASNGFSIEVAARNRLIGQNSKEADSIAGDFEQLNSSSGLSFHRLAGSVSLGFAPVLFWESLLQTKSLRNRFLNCVLESKIIRCIILSQLLLEHSKPSPEGHDRRLDMIKDLIRRNRFKYSTIQLFVRFRRICYGFRVIEKASKLLNKLCSVHQQLFLTRDEVSTRMVLDWCGDKDISMKEVSARVAELVKKAGLISR